MITRRATLADAAAIGALQLRAWWRNYQDVVDASQLSAEDEESRAAAWTELLAFGPGESFVAELAGQVYGVATVGPSREADEPDPAHPAGELWALYVDPPAQGAGVGTRLLAEAEQALRAAGHTVAVLRTLRDNGLARTFYERHGWVHEEDAPITLGWDAPHVRYRRFL